MKHLVTKNHTIIIKKSELITLINAQFRKSIDYPSCTITTEADSIKINWAEVKEVFDAKHE